jgi:hypothetical protein
MDPPCRRCILRGYTTTIVLVAGMPREGEGGWGRLADEEHEESPRAVAGARATKRLLARIPDQGVDVRIALTSSPTEVGVERLRAELRR